MFLQKLHKRLASLYFILPLVAVMMVFSFTTKNASAQFVGYTGEELFRGIYFSEGEVGQRLPEIRDYNVSNFISDPEQLQRARSFQNAIVAEIKKSNPGFLDQFQADMTSGNLSLIEASLQNGSEVMLTAVKRITDYAQAVQQVQGEVDRMESAIQSEAGNNPTKTELDQALKAYLQGIFDDPNGGGTTELIGILYLIAVFAVAVYLAAWFWTECRDSVVVNPSDSDLYKERLVFSISKL